MQIDTDTKTIKLNVIFFASFSDFIGKKEISLTLKADSTIQELQDLLFSTLSPQKKWTKPLLYAVNQKFAYLDTKLYEGDEVVFMPFVSGG